MLKQSLTDDQILSVLRDVETPQPRADLRASLIEAKPHTRNLALWAVPGSIAGVALATILAATMFAPTPSYAEVIHALKMQTKYAITDTRLFHKQKQRLISTTYRNDDLWRSGDTYGTADETVTLCSTHLPSESEPFVADYALVDSKTPPPEQSFRPEQLLWPVAKPRVQKSVVWNGRTVDIFHVQGTSDTDHPTTIDQTLIVDPNTHLPIQLISLEGDGTWGDEYDFQFTAPPSSAFVPNLPTGAKIYDLRQIRKEVDSAFSGGAGAVMLVGEKQPLGPSSVVVLIPSAGDGAGGRVVDLHVDGLGTFTGSANATWHNRLHPELAFRTIRIGGKPYLPVVFSDLGDGELGSTFNGWYRVGKVQQQLKAAPIFRSGSALDLVMSFTN